MFPQPHPALVDTCSAAPTAASLRRSATTSLHGLGKARLIALAAAVGVLGAGSPVRAAPPNTAHAAPAQPATSPAAESEPASHSVAARSRMLECGHQWSAMKKAGTATGTWKDFSRGCLAQR